MPKLAPLVMLAIVVTMILVHVAVPSVRKWMWKVAAALGVVMLAALLYFGLFWAPPEQFMSDVGRILYVHVPHVWMCLLAFTLNVGCSLAYLMKKSWVTDALAEASAEVGVYFGACGVMMGSIWARPTWGVWWDWDPRLISTTVMILAYIGYLALRSFSDDPERRATWSSAAAILSYVSLPIVWFSVKWWNSLHQQQSTPSTVDSSMTAVLRWGATTFLCFLFVFIVKRYEISRARQSGALDLPPLQPNKTEVTA